MEKFIIAILVSNHAGVLSRVTGMFTRRGFNIDSLTVGETESPEFSRITIPCTAIRRFAARLSSSWKRCTM